VTRAFSELCGAITSCVDALPEQYGARVKARTFAIPCSPRLRSAVEVLGDTSSARSV
jgi:hypothetical protein